MWKMALAAFAYDVGWALPVTERDGHRVTGNRAFAEAGLNLARG